jgi:hypothetical protein
VRRLAHRDGAQPAAQLIGRAHRHPGAEDLGRRRLGGPQVVEEADHLLA